VEGKSRLRKEVASLGLGGGEEEEDWGRVVAGTNRGLLDLGFLSAHKP
jgi:hypothetical protein